VSFTPELVKARAILLAAGALGTGTPPASFDAYVALSIAKHAGADLWGNPGLDALAFWALHAFLRATQAPTINDDGAPVGPLLAQRTGDVSQAYQSVSLMAGLTRHDADLHLTPFGIRYLEIRGQRTAGFGRLL
jgi:hypothetical protein